MNVTCEPSSEALAVRDKLAPHLDGIGVHALDYALHGWEVFPLSGKVPAIAGGRGVLDATTAVGLVIAWWTGPYRDCNIGGRVPQNAMVVDVDPRHNGAASLAHLEATHGPLPSTLTTWSGRGDGGRHLFYRKPRFRLSAARLGQGVDIKTSTGYTVLAPSVHPATGMPYTRADAPIAQPPDWLQGLLYPQPPVWAPMAAGHRPRYSLRCLVNRIKAAPVGRRNTVFYGALKDAGAALDAYADELIEAARSVGLDDSEIASTFTSARTAVA